MERQTSEAADRSEVCCCEPENTLSFQNLEEARNQSPIEASGEHGPADARVDLQLPELTADTFLLC